MFSIVHVYQVLKKRNGIPLNIDNKENVIDIKIGYWK